MGLLDNIYCRATSDKNERFSRETGFNFVLYTSLDDELISEILSFTRAETHLKDGHFLRMLYFSSVTATTLGYGDIIPLTTAARLSIAIQSVGGLFLMGLIVYWLTSNPNRDRLRITSNYS